MKIGIANGEANAVAYILRQLQSMPAWEIGWVVHDGFQAIKYNGIEPMDLVLLDINIDGLDSIEVTKQITHQSSTAVLLLVAEGLQMSSKVFEAMGVGAIDVVSIMPMLYGQEGLQNSDLMRKIATISALKGKKKPPLVAPQARQQWADPTACKGCPLVLMGASTGGPLALAKILSGLPPTFPAAVIIVQHLDEKFTSALALWLGQQCHLPIALATEGERIVEGRVLLAAKNDHLLITPQKKLKYLTRAPTDTYCPSIDALFDSAAKNWPTPSIAVLLTGMGSDGAQGLKQLRQAGWKTIAEHEDSCVIYGMPRAAIAIDAADSVLPLEKIADAMNATLEDYA